MLLKKLKAKIHRATVTQSELNYVGSITIDADLLQISGIHEYEQVMIVDINNGSRFTTYVIKGDSGSGCICLNGAAARCAQIGDKIIIMSFALLSEEEYGACSPVVVFVDDKNRVINCCDKEKQGCIENQ